MAKETYSYGKRDLFIQPKKKKRPIEISMPAECGVRDADEQKRPVILAKEAYVCAKETCACAKEGCVSGKRGLRMCKRGLCMCKRDE